MKAARAGDADAGGEDMYKGFTPPTERERSKYRAAEEAGLLGRVLEVGWAGLSAKETGRIGGMVAHRRKEKE